MHLGELFKLIHKAEPLAARHRDHICSEAVPHPNPQAAEAAGFRPAKNCP
jgi:hypothetical protein